MNEKQDVQIYEIAERRDGTYITFKVSPRFTSKLVGWSSGYHIRETMDLAASYHLLRGLLMNDLDEVRRLLRTNYVGVPEKIPPFDKRKEVEE